MRGRHARQRGGKPGAGDDHAQAAHLRVLGVVGDHVRVAVGGHDAHLVADAVLLELLRRLSIAAMSDLEPMMMPTRGASTSMPSNSASAAVSWRARRSLIRDVPAQLAAVEVDQVGGSIRGGPGGVHAVAERGHIEDAPAGRDDLAVALGGARVDDLDACRRRGPGRG